MPGLIMAELLSLLLGTVLLRPYVFLFLVVYLVAAIRDLGGRRTLAFTGWAWAVAFAAEYSSTRTGIPFGLYHYTQSTRGEELYLTNVPLMDSLAFPFLAYAAFSLARLLLGTDRGLRVIALSGVLMMWLDLVIDPLAVRGDRWFLGRVFYYPEGGVYFGVPLSNFLGWVILGWVIVGGYQVFAGRVGERPSLSRTLSWERLLGPGLYYGMLAFALALTWWIGEPLLLGVGVLLHAPVVLLLWSSKTLKAVSLGREAFAPHAIADFRDEVRRS
ncbi:MAG: carotenoid biosynthesis protein [Candidatus Methylomirabilia bacterium]